MTTQDALSFPSAASAPQSTLGLASSGTSPGRARSVHLVGLGQVGRAFLRRLAAHPLRLVAASDSSGTLADKRGLDAELLCSSKEERRPLAASGLAEDLPLELLVELIAPDVLVDAAATRFGDASAAVERSERALRVGSRVAFAAKDALAERAHAWRAEIRAGRIGCNAALGGTGRQLARELDELSGAVEELELVANATSSCVLAELERGATLDTALARARAAGLCEGNADADLDGRDAALKLAIVAGCVFGRATRVEEIERVGLRTLDPELLAWRARHGRTTRLVARATREGACQVRAEEFRETSIFAAPCDRVVYGYRLRGGRRRIHVGHGLGPARTAEALLADVLGNGGAA